MTALSFLDYMRRELPSFEIDGGPNFAVVLMVWVGFFGHPLQPDKENIWLLMLLIEFYRPKRPVSPNVFPH